MKFKQLIKEVKGDLQVKFSILEFLRNFFLNPSFRVLLNHRIGKFCHQRKNKLYRIIASRLRYKLITKRGCEISYNAVLGKKIRLAHPIGIVIGEDVVIEDNVVIFQHVTIGSHGKKGEQKEYPIIGKGVKIYAGAKVIGGLKIGANAVIGANSVINKDVPADRTAVGIPFKILNKTL